MKFKFFIYHNYNEILKCIVQLVTLPYWSISHDQSCPAHKEAQHRAKAGAGRGRLRESVPGRVLRPDTRPREDTRRREGTFKLES